MKPLATAIIGYGKISADEHIPAIEANPRFRVAASVSRQGKGPAPNFTSHGDLIAAGIELDCAAITTPPGPRFAIARDCIAAGLHLLLEKPPCATLGEIEELQRLAEAKGTTLFTSWHAQHNPAVIAAAAMLEGETIAQMRIVWHESVVKWHPGQAWIWQPGGFGVFDPGINAFSIVTRILPGAVFVREAVLSVPENSETPIAAELLLGSPAVIEPISCSFDFRKDDGEEWTICLTTTSGMEVQLVDGGKRLIVDGTEQKAAGPGEYPNLYLRFAELVDCRQSQVDMAPLRLVADALLVGRRETVAPVFN